MKTLAERLRWAIDNAPTKMNQSALAKHALVSRTSVTDWLSGKSETMKGPNLLRVAFALGVDAHWLGSGKGPRRAAKAMSGGNVEEGPEVYGSVPLISWVQAGAFATVIDNLQPGDAEDMLPSTVPVHEHTYALRVNGPSMTDPNGIEPTFPHGSIIIVEPNLIDTPKNMINLFVIVRRQKEQEATFKQLIGDGDRFLLHPLNPQFDNIALQEDDVFCGVVRAKPVRYI